MNPSRESPGLLTRALCHAALALPLLLGGAAAHATSIAAASSSGGSWVGDTWTPTATGSVVSAVEVNARLAVGGSHVTVLTHPSDPALAAKGVLTVAATSHLELSSHGDIDIQAAIHAAGADLTMRYGRGSAAAGNNANVAATAPVNLSASSTYTSYQGSDGAVINHAVITSLGAEGSLTGNDLQGMQGNVGGHYVLGTDIDASATSAWNGNAGFVPIAVFTGSFDGLGHTISNLAIHLPGEIYVGLFGHAFNTRLRNVGLQNAAISGYFGVGALLGAASGSSVTGSYAVASAVNAAMYGGVLIGMCAPDCTISKSYATGSSNGTSDFHGGLAGRLEGDISSSYAMASVTAQNYGGGLVGVMASGTLSNSYATGNVTNTSSAGYGGGLVGSFDGTLISGSYASGAVSGLYHGGLIGVRTAGAVSGSYYATTNASGGSINSNGGIGSSSGGSGTPIAVTRAQLQTLSTFSASWDIDDAGGTGKLWRIYDGQTTPLLRCFFTAPLTIAADSGSKPFDGTSTALGVTYTPVGPDARLLGNPLTTAASSTVGTHAVNVTGAYSAQQGYDITLVPGTLTINAVLVAPDAPAAPAASPGNVKATVTWTAPASDGGSPILSYTVTGTPGGTCTVTTGSPLPTTCTVPGLANGTTYTFTVKATNAAGDSVASAASLGVTPAAPVVVAPPADDPGPGTLLIDTPGVITITIPSRPIVIAPGGGGATIVLPGTGTTPVTLQITVNGQPLTVQALPGTQLQVSRVDGQNVLVLTLLQGWASMTSSAPGQPMALAGTVLLSSGSAGTRIEAQRLTVAVLQGSLLPPQGNNLPQVGSNGLLAGEKLLVDAQGKLVSITLGSLNGDTSQPGDPMVFANLPHAIDNKAFARLNGPLARLSGASLAQGLEVAPSGVVLVRSGGQIFQLLPTQPITIDATLPDGLAFTPLGLLCWVRSGVVVQFAPAVADLAGLASAVTAALPGAQLKLGAEGVLQLTTGGQTYVLRPDWTGAGTATGTPQIGADAQGRMVFQIGNGPGQLLLPALLSATQANAIFSTAIPGATLAVQPGASDGALALTVGGQAWRLVPQWVLPAGDTVQAQPWRMGADGLLYLKLGTRVQGLRIAD